MELSKNFKLSEFIKSQTASRLNIKNEPSKEEIENLKFLCENCLEKVRLLFGSPIIISSGFRSDELNKVTGGSLNSQHRRGEAADFEVLGVDNRTAFDIIRASNIPFDQLILEDYTGDPQSGWIHISCDKNRARREVLIAEFVGRKVKYTKL